MTTVGVIVVETIFLILICAGALTGNVMLFVLIAKNPPLQTKGNVFILNLAFADLLVAVVNMPVTIVTVIADDWILGENVCLASGFFTLLTFVASCMALTMISVNRYHAICHWTSYHEKYTHGKCVIYIGIVWGVTIGLSLPPFFGWAKFAYDEGQSYCFAEWGMSKSYTLFMIAACLFGPISVMSYCYAKIYRFKKQSGIRVLAAGTASDSNSNEMHTVTGTYASGELVSNASSRNDRKLSRTIMTLIVVFALCWSPFAIIMILQVFFSVDVPRWADFISLVLGYMNSFLNVFVYNATNKAVRQGYRKLLGCKPNRVDIGG
ncbi:melatonin receptor type 1B-B-like [Dendronephthya gigantea]|uniref:melatonin receptor type 1B-B-like n=1 Tax=Dendronephthya gigantea TaxID=151771 RepID=UPI00106C2F6B|nr:melatonin receptor type 1B-B-like [Dendronephthya gigantea]